MRYFLYDLSVNNCCFGNAKPVKPVEWSEDEIHYLAEHELNQGRLSFKACVGGISLLRHAVSRGFKYMGVHHMKKLHKYLNVPGAQPTTEVALVAALAGHVTGLQLSEDNLTKILAAREQVSAPEVLLKKADIFEAYMSELVETELDDENDDVKEQWQMLKRQHAAAQKRAQTRQEELIKSLARMSADSDAPDAAPDAPRPRRFIARPTKGGFSQAEASRLLPPSFVLYKDDRRENRWRLRGAALGGKEKSKSWGPNSHVDEFGALVHLLLLAWREHSDQTGEPCPFDFEGAAIG